MNINLHIERLVLDGVALEHGHEPLLQAAVAAELTRLLTTGGLASSLMSGGAQPRIHAGEIQVSGADTAPQLGHQIAHAVYGGIGR